MEQYSGGAVNALTNESCTLTLNYMYYHVLFCVVQAVVLWWFGKAQHFGIAHGFGLFALLMDYALNYMTLGTRTVAFPYLAQNLDRIGAHGGGEEALGPVGVMFFFIWFDYAAFGVLLWALSSEEYFRTLVQRGFRATVSKLRCSYIDMFALIVVPVQFWTAPWMSHHLGIDSRTLIVARSSSKLTYALLNFVFALILRNVAALQWMEDIVPIFLSGLGCGLIHHAALFTFGMRGYDSPQMLALTLLTEWPAIIAGIAVFRHCGWRFLSAVFPFLAPRPEKRSTTASASATSKAEHASSSCSNVSQPKISGNGRGTTIFVRVMYLALAALMAPHLAAINEKDAIAALIPAIPGQHMQSVGTAFFRLRTCVLPRVLPPAVRDAVLGPTLDCFHSHSDDLAQSNFVDANYGSDLLVLASAAKSGAVFSARIIAELGTSCGLCVASGERSAPGIPGPVEDLPVYRGSLLHAIINMRTWPEYAERYGKNVSTLLLGRERGDSDDRVRCVTITRDPLSRLRSLYTYARSGGEHWFRYESGMMHKLGDPSLSLQQSLDYFWSAFGRDYLIQSHEYTMMNLKLGCQSVSMESFKSDYNTTMTTLLRTYGVKEQVIPILLDRLSDADVSRKTDQQRKEDLHLTANKFSAQLVADITSGLMGMEEVRNMVAVHRRELGYEVET